MWFSFFFFAEGMMTKWTVWCLALLYFFGIVHAVNAKRTSMICGPIEISMIAMQRKLPIWILHLFYAHAARIWPTFQHFEFESVKNSFEINSRIRIFSFGLFLRSIHFILSNWKHIFFWQTLEVKNWSRRTFWLNNIIFILLFFFLASKEKNTPFRNVINSILIEDTHVNSRYELLSLIWII